MSTKQMGRFQLYITNDQRQTLQRLAKDRHQEMAELVRAAIDHVYRTGRTSREYQHALDQTFGILKSRKDIRSGIGFQNRMRKSWSR